MVKKIFCTLGFFCVVTVSITAFAADTSVGCGLGTMIWKEDSLVSTTSRVITNGIFANQIFGMTSGTSGCAKHRLVKAEMAPVYYAEANLEQLKLQMAQGEGEYLMAFAETLGCEGQNSSDNFATLSQDKYQQIFPTGKENPNQMLNNVKRVVAGSKLKNQCRYALI